MYEFSVIHEVFFKSVILKKTTGNGKKVETVEDLIEQTTTELRSWIGENHISIHPDKRLRMLASLTYAVSIFLTDAGSHTEASMS